MASGSRRSDQRRRSDAGHTGRVEGLAAIIPAYLAEATIERTLASLLCAHRVPDRIIVVVSPGDRTADIASRFAAVEVVRSPTRLSAGAARNLGAERARDCGLLLFVDADCRLHRECLISLVAELELRGYAAAAAAVKCDGSAATDRLRHLLEFKEAEGSGPAWPSWQLPSATLLCRRDCFDRVRGFPDLWPGEDLVLCQRLHASGEIARRVDCAHTYHLHPKGWRTLFGHQYRLGRTSALARRQVDLHGSWITRHLALVPLLVGGRAVRGMAWVARFRRRELAWLLAIFPVYLLALTVWTVGFSRGVRDPLGIEPFLPRPRRP